MPKTIPRRAKRNWGDNNDRESHRARIKDFDFLKASLNDSVLNEMPPEFKEMKDYIETASDTVDEIDAQVEKLKEIINGGASILLPKNLKKSIQKLIDKLNKAEKLAGDKLQEHLADLPNFLSSRDTCD